MSERHRLFTAVTTATFAFDWLLFVEMLTKRRWLGWKRKVHMIWWNSAYSQILDITIVCWLLEWRASKIGRWKGERSTLNKKILSQDAVIREFARIARNRIGSKSICMLISISWCLSHLWWMNKFGPCGVSNTWLVKVSLRNFFCSTGELSWNVLSCHNVRRGKGNVQRFSFPSK